MDNNIQDRDDQLMRYLDHEMSEGERATFEAAMKNDPELARAYNDLAAAKLAVLRFGAKEEVAAVMADKKIGIPTQTPVVQMPARRNWLRYSIAAAASVVLIFFAALLFNQNNSSGDKLFAEAYSRYEPTTSRGDVKEFSPIVIAYTSKDHAALENLCAANPSPSPTEMLMAGVDFLETGKTEKAITTFNALLNKNKLTASRAFNDEANYYLALAYLKNKNYVEAAKLMEAIHADKGNPYSEKFSGEYIKKVKVAGN